MLWISTNLVLFIGFLMFSAGILKFISSWNHLLTTLITLEFIALSLFLNLASLSPLASMDSFNALFFLAIAVCEGALGLSILVMYARNKGHDFLSFKSILQW